MHIQFSSWICLTFCLSCLFSQLHRFYFCSWIVDYFFSKPTIAEYLLYSFLGVWPEGSDGTDINALVRSHNRKVIAVADDFCKVHLFQYPCSKPKVSLDQSSPRATLPEAFLVFSMVVLEPSRQILLLYPRTPINFTYKIESVRQYKYKTIYLKGKCQSFLRWVLMLYVCWP